MIRLEHLLEKNRAWAERRATEDPGFFERLVKQQNPRFLWIGCADSRVPANSIVDIDPGEMFVHRNIANVVAHTDLNLISVLQFAVEVLKVEHIIVCGHYGCGGVKAALENKPLGMIDNWLRHIRDVAQRHEEELMSIPDKEARVHRLCELNVVAQVSNVAHSSVVQEAWRRGQRLIVNGWIYHLTDGILRDLKVPIQSTDAIPPIYRLVE